MNAWLLSIITIWAFVSFAYLISRILKRNDLMDVFWGVGFLFLSIVLLLKTNYLPNYKLVLVALIALWSIRLSLHVLIKNWGKPEDFRYANWRKEWGETEWWRSYLQINLLQGFFMFIIALPIISVLQKPETFGSFPIDSFTVYPVIITSIGLLIESIADFQKSQFKKHNKTGIMKTGLWKYSRHPNYFGEAIFWWGIALFSILTYPIFGLISAVTITYLLRYVSGVPMLEKAKVGNTEYEAYKKETPIFAPFLKP